MLVWAADRFVHYANLVSFLPLMFHCFTDPVDADVDDADADVRVLVVEVCDGCL